MTHDAFRRRLEALEEARALRDAPPQLISIGFVNGDKTPVIPTVAWTMPSFQRLCGRRGVSESRFYQVGSGATAIGGLECVQFEIIDDNWRKARSTCLEGRRGRLYPQPVNLREDALELY
jgi:hypothetical protein